MRRLVTISFLHLLLATKLTLAAESTCPYQTANYIVHGLPQQCLAEYHKPLTVPATTQTVSSPNSDGRPDASVASIAEDPSPTDSPHPSISLTSLKPDSSTTLSLTAEGSPSHPPAPPNTTTTITAATVVAVPIPHSEEEPPRDPDADPDSALDPTQFLSFEEWRAQNLEKAGQGQVRQNIGERGIREPRKRPGGMNNDIDSIGDDAEIDLNFGFGGTGPSQPAVGTSKGSQIPETEIVPPKGQARSKNAGKTGKERFNYASFDCAATVHKTNPGVKGTNAILVENKDSYMLNKCAEQNKFIIVELCDDILVDTVVLANFEFFSSMFREFRVSVSDRYPIKASGWKELGVFTGRNSREIQPFMVENPQIWARYMKIEFLSHYGNEFYCPISLIRVHGTTMMEEFKAQEEAARGMQEDDVEEIMPEVVAEEIKQSIAEEEAAHATPTEEPKLQVEMEENAPQPVAKPVVVAKAIQRTGYLALPPPSRFRCTTSPRIPIVFQRDSQACSAIPVTYSTAPGPAYATESALPPQAERSVTLVDQTEISATPVANTGPTRPVRSKTELHNPNASTPTDESTAPVEVHPPPAKDPKPASPPPQERPAEKVTRRPSAPPAPNPPPTYIPRYTPPTYQPPPPPPSPHGAPTQDNFFKSIHKRLQTLEVDATLSLQYIEEQSRILRDAFAKMEKLQTSKTQKFMEKLNVTVMNELLLFRRQYDQLHQSTVIALESHRRATSLSEAELTEQLAILAEEVLYQRKFGYVQSFLLLVCILLVLFNQSQTFIESPLLNSVKAQSLNAFKRWESPPSSPPAPTTGLRVPNGGMRRQASGLRHMRTQSDTLDLASVSSPDLPSTSNALTDSPTKPTINIPDTPHHLLATPYATPSLEFSPPTPPRSQRTTPAGTPYPNGTGSGTNTPRQPHAPRRIATEPPLDAWLEYPTLESVLDGSSSPRQPPSATSSSVSSHSRNSSLEDAEFDAAVLEGEDGSLNGASSQGSSLMRRLKRKRKGLLVDRNSSSGSSAGERKRGSEFGGAWSEPVNVSRTSSRSNGEEGGGRRYESSDSAEEFDVDEERYIDEQEERGRRSQRDGDGGVSDGEDGRGGDVSGDEVYDGENGVGPGGAESDGSDREGRESEARRRALSR